MKRQSTITAIFALFIFALGVNSANAQLGGLLKKTQDKIDKTQKQVDKNKPNTNQTTPQTNTPQQQTTNSNNGDLGWTDFKCNPEFIGSVNEAKLREMIQYNLNNDYGKGGLIVFTRQPLAKNNATLADSVMTFKAGEPIYLNIVLKQPRKPDAGDIFLRMPGESIATVGDTKCENQHSFYVDYERFDQIPATLDFQPQGGKSAKHQRQVKSIAEQLRALPPGVHIIPVRLESISALGAFYYDNRNGQANDDASKAAVAEVKMPVSAVKMPALEKQIINSWNSTPGSTALRIVLTDRDWSPLRFDDGTLRGRYITAVLATKKDGKCFREIQLWAQNYNGSGYTGLFMEGSRDREEMACENV